MQEKISALELQLASGGGDRSSLPTEQCGSEEYIDDLRKKIQLQVIFKTSTYYPCLVLVGLLLFVKLLC